MWHHGWKMKAVHNECEYCCIEAEEQKQQNYPEYHFFFSADIFIDEKYRR